jgi:hypothetical protein
MTKENSFSPPGDRSAWRTSYLRVVRMVTQVDVRVVTPVDGGGEAPLQPIAKKLHVRGLPSQHGTRRDGASHGGHDDGLAALQLAAHRRQRLSRTLEDMHHLC